LLVATPHREALRRRAFGSPRRRAHVAFAVLRAGLLLASAFAACSSPSDFGTDAQKPDATDDASPAMTCPATPSGCANVPSYANDIAPLVKRTCATCHAPGGVASDRDLTTYAGVSRWASTAYAQLIRCLMPPLDAGPDAMVTASERGQLEQWINCGAPDN
jgi:hypothetical protein